MAFFIARMGLPKNGMMAVSNIYFVAVAIVMMVLPLFILPKIISRAGSDRAFVIVMMALPLLGRIISASIMSGGLTEKGCLISMPNTHPVGLVRYNLKPYYINPSPRTG